MPADVQSRRDLMKTLRDEGFLVHCKRGRPAIYDSDEARKAALREQKRICNRRYAERIREAKTQMLDAQGVRSSPENFIVAA